MPCNFICLFCTKVIVGFCILHKNLALTLPCHFPPAPHLPVALMVLPVENGAFSAACTQLVGRQDLQIVSTNTEQDFFPPLFFSLLTLTVITVGQSKSSRKDPSCPDPDTFPPSFILLLFVLHWSCTLVLWEFGDRLCMVYFYGAAIWRPQMPRSFILQSIHSLALCSEKEKARAHIAFHDLLCQTSTQTNRWESWCEVLVYQTHQNSSLIP